MNWHVFAITWACILGLPTLLSVATVDYWWPKRHPDIRLPATALWVVHAVFISWSALAWPT